MDTIGIDGAYPLMYRVLIYHTFISIEVASLPAVMIEYLLTMSAVQYPFLWQLIAYQCWPVTL